MKILVNPVPAGRSQGSCNYKCPVYKKGKKGIKKIMKKFYKDKKKNKNSKEKICWYGN